MKTKYYLGIDLHKQFAYWHLINEGGDILWTGKVLSTARDTKARLEQLGISLSEITAAIESVEHYGWYADLLVKYGVGTVTRHYSFSFLKTGFAVARFKSCPALQTATTPKYSLWGRLIWCTGMQEVRTSIIESEYNYLPSFVKREVVV